MGSRYNLRSRSKQPLILILPKEVLERILNYVPQEETLNIRLVCKDWDKAVENFYDYKIGRLDENSSHFQRILALRITKLSISRLRNTSVLNSEGISIFKHPNLIRNLKIEPYSSISPDNLQQLLGLCVENVRILDLELSQEHIRYEVFESYKFSNLQHLRIDAYLYKKNPESLFQMIENWSMPKLAGLEIGLTTFEIPLRLVRRIPGKVIGILSKQGKYLEKLHLAFDHSTLGAARLLKPTLPLQQDELDRIKAINGLKKFDVRFQPFEPKMKDFWLELLSTQKNLVSLTTQFPVSVSLCRQIVTKNFETLVDIEIQKLDMADDPIFDLSVFQNCYKLEKLILNRRSRWYHSDLEQTSVRQFNCLPESIKSLEVYGQRILSEELIMAFTQTDDSSTNGFKNLQQLTLRRCGDRGSFGITGRILSEILMISRPNLREVNFSLSFNKDESFKIAMQRLNLSTSDLCELMRGSWRSGFGWVPSRWYSSYDSD